MKKIFFLLCLASLASALERNISTLSGEFIQYLEQEKIEYRGKFYFKAPKMAKWEYLVPVQKVVYIQGETLISYEPMLEQAIYHKIQKDLDLLSIIQNAKQDTKDKNLYLARVQGVLYRLYVQDEVPQALEYEDSLGNSVVIEMKNLQINQNIDSSIFEFKPSANIDIVRE